MAQKKSYSRYFIILQEDEKGYALASDKLPTGYVKLEMKNNKCKVSYYVQNLKKQEQYFMVLICSKKDTNKVIKIGQLNIDDYGRADISYEYPVDSIGNSGIAMDKISGGAIVKFLDSNIVPILTGFATTDIPEWRKYNVVEDSKRGIEEQDKEAETADKSIFDKYEESIEISKSEVENSAVKVEKESKENDDNKEEVQEKLDRSESENLEANEEKNTKISSKSNNIEENTELNNSSADIEENNNENNNTNNTDIETHSQTAENIIDENKYREENADYPTGAVGEFFKSIAEGFEELVNVCTDIKRCKWYKIPFRNIKDISNTSDYNKYTVMYYPMINYYSYIKKHGHYVVGYKCDKKGKIKYLVYGIPGTKAEKDQPYGGKSGFVTWIPLVQGKEDDDSFGYWLMFYDFRTSTIVIPVK